MHDSSTQRDIRNAILDATDRLLARDGYKKMTIEELAREVGIGKGSVYLHFTSKEQIALSHIDRIIERLKQRLSNIAHGSGSCADRLRNMLIERVIFRFDSVSDYSQNINDMLARLRPQLLMRREQYFADEAAILIAVIAEGIERGEFEGVNKEDAADALIVATNSLLPYSLSTKELGGREEILVRVQKVADLLLSGLKARR
jgi:AcrR family transcriptional regulator